MSKIKSKPYQKIGVFRILNRFKGRALLADDIGLGKTRQSLLAALQLRHKRPIIVICPNSVKYGWEEEVKLHTGLNAWVLHGRKPPRQVPLYVPPVIILNWEILDAWVRFLLRLDPRIIIPDEIHWAKNRRARRTRALRRLCRDVPFVIGLTGTPFENCPAELFVALNIIRPDKFPAFVPFGTKFCRPRRTPWGIEYKGASNIPKLRKLLRSTCMIRRTRAKVLKELPPLTQTVIPFEIKRKEYDRAERDLIAWLIRKGTSTRGAMSAPGLARFTHLLQLVAKKKTPAVIEWIDNFLEGNPKEKLVVFGFHRAFLKPLYDHYKKQAVLVDGSVTGRKRQMAIDKFASSKRVRLFFGNILAAGTGINKLQRASKTVAIAEFIWVPKKISQAIGRVHRLGQKRKTNAFFLVARDTIEYSLCKALIRKDRLFDEIIDGKMTDGEFDILQTVVGKMKRRRR